MQMPFTLRLAYHSFRAVVRAGLLLLIAWLLLIPATAAEREALDARDGTTYPAGLRPMRTAQIVVAVAPPQAYGWIGRMLSPQMPGVVVEFALNQIAAGIILPQTATQDQAPYSARDIEGPKFIRVD